MPEMGLRFILVPPVYKHDIPGMRKLSHVDSNIAGERHGGSLMISWLS